MSWIVTWKGALAAYLIAALIVGPVLWAAICTPGRREERAMEQARREWTRTVRTRRYARHHPTRTATR